MEGQTDGVDPLFDLRLAKAMHVKTANIRQPHTKHKRLTNSSEISQ